MMKLKWILLTSLMFTVYSNSIAQEKTYVQTINDTTSTQYDKIVKYFVLDKTEVKKLFKIDLFQLAMFNLNLNYEFKLSNKTSIELGCMGTQYDVGDSYSYNSLGFGFSSGLEEVYNLNLSSDIRYYYNVDRRISKGKNTNGFSANYFSLGVAAKMFFFDKESYYVNNFGLLRRYSSLSFPDISPQTIFKYWNNEGEASESIYLIKAGYGFQRRIGNVGYIGAECKLGLGTNKNFDRMYMIPELSFKAGFAFKSFKKR